MNLEKIYSDLTEMHILALYDFMCPIEAGYTAEIINARRANAIKRYQNDPIFYSRVAHIVSFSIKIFEKYR